MTPDQIRAQQAKCLELEQQGLKQKQIAEQIGISTDAVRRRLRGAKKAARLDPYLQEQLNRKGITDLAGLHSGWLLEKDEEGSGHSLYFYLGPDEKIGFVEAMEEVLHELPVLAPIDPPARLKEAGGHATFLFQADLHLGAHYGDPTLIQNYGAAVDDLIPRLPPAEKAFLVELGDLFDANDHKGITPASGNDCDVIRHDTLWTTQKGVAVMDYTVQRLLQSHRYVEVHMIPGNHDPTSYHAVLLTLAERYSENSRVEVIIPKDVHGEEFRVIPWGWTAVLPHHGHTLKPKDLKNVFTDQFSRAYADAESYRLIATGHFHSDKLTNMGGVDHRQFGTLVPPNQWARMKGLHSMGILTAMTLHRRLGYRGETASQIQNIKKLKDYVV